MTNHHHYTYRVEWSSEDDEYVGLCSEFPSLSNLHKKQLTALSGIIDLVEDVVNDMQENGEDVPTPFSEKKYSGKFQIRITPEQHRNLAIKASEEGVSLNHLANTKLCS